LACAWRRIHGAPKLTLRVLDTIKFHFWDHCGRRVTSQLGPVPC
jgi:hypothetical protein